MTTISKNGDVGTEFKVKINGGKTQTLQTRSGIYWHAAVAALVMLPYRPKPRGPDVVKIWSEACLPDYGPYTYEISDYPNQCIETKNEGKVGGGRSRRLG